jgi:hypothetical protein
LPSSQRQGYALAPTRLLKELILHNSRVTATVPSEEAIAPESAYLKLANSWLAAAILGWNNEKPKN